MQNKVQLFIKFLFKLCFIYMAVVSGAHALLMGNIEVRSRLGEVLNVKIALVDPGDIQHVQVHLANRDQYQRFGLQYPEGVKFRFELLADEAKRAYIHVSTPRPVDEPFINLLVEVEGESGLLSRTYTFLLDPVLFMPVETALQPEPEVNSHAGPVKTGSLSSESGTQKSVLRHRKPHQRVKKTQPVASVVQEASSRMKLSMSLSISRYDAAAPVSANIDAMQDDLMAKQKLLEDLRLQISGMKLVINTLLHKTEPVASAPLDVQSAALAASEPVAIPTSNGALTAIEVASQPTATPLSDTSPTTPAMQANPPAVMVREGYGKWLYPAMALLLLGGGIGYWKYRKATTVKHGTFDYIHEAPADFETSLKMPAYVPPKEVSSSPPLPDSSSRKVEPEFSEQTMEMMAYNAQASSPVVPSEYAILMEANRYSRAGNDVLAEEALMRAIEANPKNSYGYLALLKIYQRRNDVISFAEIVQKLKEIGDDEAFAEAVEQGREIDPDNPLYA